MKEFEQYGKMKEPRKGKVKKTENIEKKEVRLGYFEIFNGKEVECKIVNSDIINGVLRSDSYNKYDVIIETENEQYLIRKDVIEYIKLEK